MPTKQYSQSLNNITSWEHLFLMVFLFISVCGKRLWLHVWLPAYQYYLMSDLKENVHCIVAGFHACNFQTKQAQTWSKVSLITGTSHFQWWKLWISLKTFLSGTPRILADAFAITWCCTGWEKYWCCQASIACILGCMFHLSSQEIDMPSMLPFPNIDNNQSMPE